MEGPTHEPVLLHETLEQLAIRADGFYVDGTYGRGGHAREIVRRLGPRGRVWLLDRDPDACAHARQTFKGDSRIRIVEDSFMNLPEHLDGEDLHAQLDGLLLDLGVSSGQLDQSERGFSFRHDGPLDMRMSRSGQSAAQWLEQVDEKALAEVLATLGEERYARRIARAIIRERDEKPLTRTTQLAQLISRAVPRTTTRLHPATRSFQAIRMFINRELEQLERLLEQVLEVLAGEARLAVISFHSLEDRRVKQFMRACSTPPAISRHHPPVPFTPSLEVYPLIRPSTEEIERNPRARSARLRVARRLPCAA